MNRRHARPMTAHERARQDRPDYEPVQLLLFVLLIAAILAAGAVTGPMPGETRQTEQTYRAQINGAPLETEAPH